MKSSLRPGFCPICGGNLNHDMPVLTCGNQECINHLRAIRATEAYAMGIPDMDLAERIQANSMYFSPTGSCWIWTAALAGSSDGRNHYGCLKYQGKMVLAHRASYEAFVGVIPTGKDVLHNCTETRCVNPGHLYTGSRSEQLLASVKRGTHARKNYQITPEVAETIRQLVYVGQFKNADIAQKYDISAGQVSKIAHRQIYNDRPLTEEELEALKRRDHEARKRARSKQRKLTDKQVREIKVSGDDRTILAERYGVHRSYIDSIKRGEARTDVERNMT